MVHVNGMTEFVDDHIANELRGKKQQLVLGDYRLFFVTLYPEDSKVITPSKYSKEFIEAEINQRILEYKSDGRTIDLFENNWKDVFQRVEMKWATWEEVVDEMKDQYLAEFYRLCKRFGKKKGENTSTIALLK